MKTIFKISVLLFLLFSCTKEELERREYPRLTTKAVTNISTEGATFNAAIDTKIAATITDHGFLWRVKGFTPANSNADLDPLEVDYNKISLGRKDDLGAFSTEINYALFPDKSYAVRSYIVTDGFTVYGNTVFFESKGSSLVPNLIDFIPKTGGGGDTVRITGNNFSGASKENIVRFGTYESKVIRASRTEIWCILPFNIPDPIVKISVRTLDKPIITFEENFLLAKSIITDFSPKEGTFGDKVTISGTGFSNILSNNIVRFGEVRAKIINSSYSELLVQVPDSVAAASVPIQVTVSNINTISDTNFTLIPPKVTSISPTEVGQRDILTLYGNFFSPISLYNSIYLGNLEIPVYGCCSKGFISVQLPGGGYESRRLRVSVETVGKRVYTDFYATIKGWLKKKEMPFTAESMVGFSISNKGYIGLGKIDKKEFWQFDPFTDQWSRIADYKGSPRCQALNFVIGNVAYVGGGTSITSENVTYQDFWGYDMARNTWSKIKDFPAGIPKESVTFVANNKGYICTKSNPTDIWEYDPSTDNWTKVKEMQLPYPNAKPYAAFIHESVIYIQVTDATPSPTGAFYTFNPYTFELKQHGNINSIGYVFGNPFVASIRGKAYFFLQNGNIINEFNPDHNSLTNVYDSHTSNSFGSRDRFVGFAIGEEIYIGGGFGGVSGYQLQSDLWEFRIE